MNYNYILETGLKVKSNFLLVCCIALFLDLFVLLIQALYTGELGHELFTIRNENGEAQCSK